MSVNDTEQTAVHRLELLEGGGLNARSSCLQTLIVEWKSVLNFNPWAKFLTFLLGHFQHWPFTINTTVI